MNKIVALTDLDGTLLLPDATLSDFTVSVMTKALDDGHVVSFATARSYTSSQRLVGAIPWRYPLVLYNGALLYDPVEKKPLDGAFLGSALTNELLMVGRTFGHCPLLFALDEEDSERVLHEPLTASGYREFRAGRPGDNRFIETAALSCAESLQTLILTYIGHQHELMPLLQALQTQFAGRIHLHFLADTYIPDHYFLEISHPKANKRDGLFMWANSVGCLPEDIVAFGDNLNDIGLLQAAGTKIAVGNAHPGLKDIAQKVIGRNVDDGVAQYLLHAMGGSSRLSS